MSELTVHLIERHKHNVGHVMLDSGSESWAEGYAFRAGELLAGSGLAEETARRCTAESREAEASSWIAELNGFFSLVAACQGTVVAAVDLIRSRPLFYATRGERLIISDDAYWLRDQVGAQSFDPVAREEYLFTGYVTGADTLCSEIKQLQAGEMLIATLCEGRWRLETKRYYVFRPSDATVTEKDPTQLCEMFHKVLQAAYDRLVRYADGRTIVLPLSGGYDSRLTALMLKQIGYENLVAFSYGRNGNQEAEISESVADALNIPWRFVEYTNERWYEWYRSSEFRTFLAGCDGLCAFPYITSWPAVAALHSRGVLPSNAVFVPGHALDFIAGSHMACSNFAAYRVLSGKLESSPSDRERVLRAIIARHYDKWIGPNRPKLRLGGSPVFDKLASCLSEYELHSVRDAVSLYEMWVWQERQVKAIANTVRIYEYWGYDWSLPAWDSEILRFWETAPFEFRWNRSLCKRYITALSHTNLQDEIPFEGASPELPASVRNYALRAARKASRELSNLMALIPGSGYQSAMARDVYHTDPLALYGIMREEEFMRYGAWRYLPHAVWIWDKLGEIKLTMGDTHE